MISTAKTRLGALRCPVAMHVGTGAKVAFGADWRARSLMQQQSALTAARVVDLIPSYAVDNSTSVSAPPERSP